MYQKNSTLMLKSTTRLPEPLQPSKDSQKSTSWRFIVRWSSLLSHIPASRKLSTTDKLNSLNIFIISSLCTSNESERQNKFPASEVLRQAATPSCINPILRQPGRRTAAKRLFYGELSEGKRCPKLFCRTASQRQPQKHRHLRQRGKVLPRTAQRRGTCDAVARRLDEVEQRHVCCECENPKQDAGRKSRKHLLAVLDTYIPNMREWLPTTLHLS